MTYRAIANGPGETLKLWACDRCCAQTSMHDSWVYVTSSTAMPLDLCPTCAKRALALTDPVVEDLEQQLAGERTLHSNAFNKMNARFSSELDELRTALDTNARTYDSLDASNAELVDRLGKSEAALSRSRDSYKELFEQLVLAKRERELARGEHCIAVVERDDSINNHVATIEMLDERDAELSDVRDEVELTEALVREVMSMLGKKARKRNKPRLAEILLSLAPSPSEWIDDAEVDQ